jgi:hypothetical protein
MSAVGGLGALAGRIVAVHEMLNSMGVTHQFGGAIALAWYRNPRATTDIDLNVTLPPEDAAPVLGALTHLGVSVSPADRDLITRDGQARLDWDGSYLDVFFATFEGAEDPRRDPRAVRAAGGAVGARRRRVTVAAPVRGLAFQPSNW